VIHFWVYSIFSLAHIPAMLNSPDLSQSFTSGGMMFIPSFMNIRQLVQQHTTRTHFNHKPVFLYLIKHTPWRRISCLIKHHEMNTYWGSGCISPCILNLGTGGRWMISFTPRPLYSRGKSPQYTLVRRLDGHKSRSGRCEDENRSRHCKRD